MLSFSVLSLINFVTNQGVGFRWRLKVFHSILPYFLLAFMSIQRIRFQYLSFLFLVAASTSRVVVTAPTSPPSPQRRRTYPMAQILPYQLLTMTAGSCYVFDDNTSAGLCDYCILLEDDGNTFFYYMLHLDYVKFPS